jgi:hypothetical protein
MQKSQVLLSRLLSSVSAESHGVPCPEEEGRGKPWWRVENVPDWSNFNVTSYRRSETSHYIRISRTGARCSMSQRMKDRFAAATIKGPHVNATGCKVFRRGPRRSLFQLHLCLSESPARYISYHSLPVFLSQRDSRHFRKVCTYSATRKRDLVFQKTGIWTS